MWRPLPLRPVSDATAILTETRPGPLEPDDADSAAREELARVNFRVQKTVEERTMKLREMIAELDAVSYALVQDMRAPLRAIRGFAELLGNEPPPDPEDRKSYLDRIARASNRLDKLIQDALAYNRTMFRLLPLQAVHMGRLVREILVSHPEFKWKDADIRVEGELPMVLGNESLLTQCLVNLLDNAVKFVTPGTRPQVRIRAECTTECARIWVEDNGIGIARPGQKRLFGLFQKLNSDSEGTGLGLAIVRKAVERMNGRLGVESEPGRGSQFWLELKRVDWPTTETFPEANGEERLCAKKMD